MFRRSAAWVLFVGILRGGLGACPAAVELPLQEDVSGMPTLCLPVDWGGFGRVLKLADLGSEDRRT